MADISIIVPIYNAQNCIEKCIDSIINQTKKELEIILINDGSTDDTDKIIKKYNDKRIKYFINNNCGIGSTRNFGIEKATSKYILFIDSDDYLELDACEKLYKKIEADKSDIVVYNFNKIEKDIVEKVTIQPFLKTKLMNTPHILLDINMSPWNKLYKRELIIKNKIRFVENLKYEDAPFVAEALYKAENISYLNEYLYNYIIHSNSETTIRDKKMFDIIKIVDIIRKKLNEPYLTDTINKLTVRILTNYTIQQRYNKNKIERNKFIDKAFDYLKNNVKDYKNNKYYKNRGIRKYIEKSRIVTKIYCIIYNAI